MSENLRTFIRAAYALDAVACRVPATAWDNPSPCAEWSARQVAGHASWVLQSIAAATGYRAAPEPRPEAEVAGDDPAATVRASVDEVLAALDRPGVLNTVAPTPFGEMPVDAFIGTMWVDPLTHAYDIAAAAGVDPGIDAATAAAAQATLAPLGDALRGSGRFDPAVDVADDADALTRFIAFTGRSV